MTMLINILTMALCIGAMTYCYVLGKQVKSLRNMREGVGALIEDMIKTTNDLQYAFEVTKQTVSNEYERLRDTIDEGAALSDYLTTLIENAQAIEHNIQTIHKKIMAESRPTPIQPKQPSVSPSSHPHHDPLADVMPKDFGKRSTKRPISYIIPNEEYL